MRKREVQSEPKFRKPLRSTQSFLPIRDFYYDMVITDDDRYLKIIEVAPINFNTLPQKEQDNVALMFANLLKIAPINIQITAVAGKADLSVQRDILKSDYDREKYTACRRISEEYDELLVRTERSSVSRRYFITIEYEKKGNVFTRPPLDSILASLNTVAQRIEVCLSACGNSVVAADPENPILYPAEILYTLLNRNSSQSFEEHIGELYWRYTEDMTSRQVYIPATDMIAPGNIVLRDKKYIVVDGTYYTFAYIPQDGYNSQVISGWLKTFISSYEGVDINIFMNRMDTNSVLTRVRRNITLNRVALSETADASEAFDTNRDTLNATYYLRNGLTSGEDFWYLAILITVTGRSPDEVDAKMDELEKRALQNGVTLQSCDYEQEQAFLSALPLAKMDKRIWDKAKRNILTTDAGSLYPFTTFELNDPEGIQFGMDRTNSPVILDTFNQFRFKNANVFICGSAGGGKSFTMMLMALRMRLKHIPVFIISPAKEHEFSRLCNAVGGKFVHFGGGSDARINVMEIIRRDEEAVRKQEMLDGRKNTSYLTEKISFLKKFFSLLITDITPEERTVLDVALHDVYASFGITSDNESLYDPEDRTRYRRMPTIKDLQIAMSAKPESARMGNILRVLTQGSASFFDGDTNIDLSGDDLFVVFGFDDVEDYLMPLVMSAAMETCWSYIKQDRTKKKALFIDEWWRIAYNPEGAAYSMEIARTIRSYGGSLVIATQDIEDILAVEDGKYTKPVLSQTAIKILVKMEDSELQSVGKLIDLTESDIRAIQDMQADRTFTSRYLIAGKMRMPVRLEATPTEYRYVTTRREELKDIIDSMESDSVSMEEIPLDSEFDFISTEVPETESVSMETEQDTEELSAVQEEIILEPEDDILDFDELEDAAVSDGLVDFDEL